MRSWYCIVELHLLAEWAQRAPCPCHLWGSRLRLSVNRLPKHRFIISSGGWHLTVIACGSARNQRIPWASTFSFFLAAPCGALPFSDVMAGSIMWFIAIKTKEMLNEWLLNVSVKPLVMSKWGLYLIFCNLLGLQKMDLTPNIWRVGN